jgi:hypothetical protein
VARKISTADDAREGCLVGRVEALPIGEEAAGEKRAKGICGVVDRGNGEKGRVIGWEA